MSEGRLGFVAWGGETLAELMPDGSWVCHTAGVRDPELERGLFLTYLGRSTDPSRGHPARGKLAHLADAVGGVHVDEVPFATGLVY